MLRQGGALGLATSLVGPGKAELAQAEAGMPALYIFLHTDAKPAALTRALSRKLNILDVTVVTKYRDLEDGLSAKSLDVLMAPSPVLDSLHIDVGIQGMRNNKAWEPYVLVSSDDISLDHLDGKTVGVVDMLGRDEMQKLVDSVLGTKGMKVRRVTKLEDLLALLLLSAADAILVGESIVPLFQQRSRNPLNQYAIPGARLGLPSVGFLNQNVRPIVTNAVLGIEPETNRMLGVERWMVR